MAVHLLNPAELGRIGLTPEDVERSIKYVHDTLDALDQTLLARGAPRLAELVELANLSAFIGNLFRLGVVSGSNGKFKGNGPHKYPDLLAVDAACKDLEIKVALEANRPKGHLPKAGPHLTVHYVLASESGSFARRAKDQRNRGNTARIWKVSVGTLSRRHFSVSNTKGDSGKTAVINALGMKKLKPVYFVEELCPHAPRGRSLKAVLEAIARLVLAAGRR